MTSPAVFLCSVFSFCCCCSVLFLFVRVVRLIARSLSLSPVSPRVARGKRQGCILCVWMRARVSLAVATAVISAGCPLRRTLTSVPFRFFTAPRRVTYCRCVCVGGDSVSAALGRVRFAFSAGSSFDPSAFVSSRSPATLGRLPPSLRSGCAARTIWALRRKEIDTALVGDRRVERRDGTFRRVSSLWRRPTGRTKPASFCFLFFFFGL